MVWCIAHPHPLQIHKHNHMKNYKYPQIQWIAGAMGIPMIITVIMTVIIWKVSLLETAFYHHILHKWNQSMLPIYAMQQ